MAYNESNRGSSVLTDLFPDHRDSRGCDALAHRDRGIHILFLVIKCGMAAGILGVLLTMKKPYLVLWCLSSFAAIFMTIAKWSLSGAFRGSFALAMGTDIVVPVVGVLLWRKYHE